MTHELQQQKLDVHVVPKKVKEPEEEEEIEFDEVDGELLALGTLEPRTMDPTWYNALKPEFDKAYFKQLKQFLKHEIIDLGKADKIRPELDDIYSWTRHCPLDDIKVIIIGQDPYHTPGCAHGLCFSVPPEMKRLPPSLINIYNEIVAEYSARSKEPLKKPAAFNQGNLAGWAKQGVLLLNAVLTVELGKANSHKNNGWERLTDAALKQVLLANGHCDNSPNAQKKSRKGIVIMLWGSYAQKKAESVLEELQSSSKRKAVDTPFSIMAKRQKLSDSIPSASTTEIPPSPVYQSNKNEQEITLRNGLSCLVLKSPHPSPLSAHRGFMGNGHFLKANDFLERHGESEIDWLNPVAEGK